MLQNIDNDGVYTRKIKTKIRHARELISPEEKYHFLLHCGNAHEHGVSVYSIYMIETNKHSNVICLNQDVKSTRCKNNEHFMIIIAHIKALNKINLTFHNST